MWFKKLSFFRLDEHFAIEADKLADALAARPFTGCGGLDWFSEGWTPPAEHLDGPLFNQRGYTLVSLRREDKVLPAGVIRDALAKKVADIERDELRKVGRKERLALKEQVTDDLLPRAFTSSSRTTAYIDRQRGWLMVEASVASKAEKLVSQLREALPPFPAALPRTVRNPREVMTAWLAAGEAPHGFVLDSDAYLQDGSERGAQVGVKHMDLTADEVRQHIATGKQVTKLGLVWRERIRFVLNDELRLQGLQFLDVLQEEASQAGDDMASLFEATFLLMAEELGELVDDLVQAMGGLDDSQQSSNTATAAPTTATAVTAEHSWV